MKRTIRKKHTRFAFGPRFRLAVAAPLICMTAWTGSACSEGANTTEASAEFLAHELPTAGSHPYILVPGPDGKLWFSESGADRIGRMDVDSGKIEEFATPTPGSHPIGVIAGVDGNVWFSENAANKIGRITPAGIISEFDCPTRNAGPNGINRRADGAIWFAESNVDQIATISYDGRITEYRQGISPLSHPLAPVARRSELWFSEPDGDRLGVFDHGRITEVPLPAHSQPRAMTVDEHQNLWYVATGAKAVVRVDSLRRFRTFASPDRDASLRSIAVAHDGTVWFTEDLVNKIAALRPADGSSHEFLVPAPMQGLRGICVWPDGRIFFAAYDSGHIGEFRLGRSSRRYHPPR